MAAPSSDRSTRKESCPTFPVRDRSIERVSSWSGPSSRGSSYALSPRPKVEKPQAAGLDDFTLPTAEEGRPIPVVFGTMLITGPNVVWAGDLKVDPIKKKGGKK